MLKHLVLSALFAQAVVASNETTTTAADAATTTTAAAAAANATATTTVAAAAVTTTVAAAAATTTAAGGGATVTTTTATAATVTSTVAPVTTEKPTSTKAPDAADSTVKPSGNATTAGPVASDPIVAVVELKADVVVNGTLHAKAVLVYHRGFDIAICLGVIAAGLATTDANCRSNLVSTFGTSRQLSEVRKLSATYKYKAAFSVPKSRAVAAGVADTPAGVATKFVTGFDGTTLASLYELNKGVALAAVLADTDAAVKAAVAAAGLTIGYTPPPQPTVTVEPIETNDPPAAPSASNAVTALLSAASLFFMGAMLM